MADDRRPIVALVQARMGSSRLPGKVLRQVAGRSLLAHLLARLQAARTLDRIVVATTDDPRDDAVVQEAARLGVPAFRGSVEDVLDRFARAAAEHDAATVVRVTGDCPLMDPAEVDRVVTEFLNAGADYTTNQLPGQRRLPLGLAVEVFTRQALQRAADEAREPWQREHVTPYLYDTPGRFRLHFAEFAEDFSRFRITVDTPEDLAVVAPVLEALEGRADAFTLAAAVGFLQAHPEIASINMDIRQKRHTEAAGTVALLRADATAAGGTGHVMRLLGIGEAWLRRGGKAVLLSARLPEAFADRLRAAGVDVAALPDDIVPGTPQDAAATRDFGRQCQARLILADGYPFVPPENPMAWLASLRDPAWRVAYVDDFGQPDLPVDAVLMPNAGAVAPPGHVAPLVLAGAAFTPVRGDFRDALPPQRTFSSTSRHLLLTFGGSDPARMSARALRAALQVAREVPLRVTVLLGAVHPDVAAVQRLADTHPQVRVLHDVHDMAALFADTDLAMTAGGTTCWELARLGVPMLLVQVADNQSVVLQGIVDVGAGRALPPASDLTDAELTGGLRAFVTASPSLLAAMSAAGQRLIDGRGAERLADALAALISGG